jgi:hypothetical protein
MSGDVVTLSIIGLFVAVLVAYGWGPIRPRLVDQWAIRFDVLVTSTDAPVVRHRLRRARGIRWTASGIGVLVATAPVAMNLIDAERSTEVATPLISLAPVVFAAVGAVIAEVAVVQRPAAQISDLRLRRASDYVPTHWLAACATGIVVTVAATVWAASQGGMTGWSWTASALVIITAVVSAWGVRRIVDRPRSTVAARSIDDALRADGVHHIVGATVAVTGSAAARAVTAASGDWWVVLPASVVYCGALWCWYWIAATDRWNVARARLHNS